MKLKGRIAKAVICLIPFLIMSCSVFKANENPAGHEDRETSAPAPVLSGDNDENLEAVVNEQAAKIEQNAETIRFQKNKIAALESRIQNLEKKQPSPTQLKLTRVKYKNPETLYAKARNFLLEENYLQAAGLFSTFINDHPKHALADNATYWLGECHYAQGNYQQAVFLFKGLVKRYPKSQKVPDAILKTGYAYLSINDSNRAHHYLKEVIKKYPFSPAAEKAQKKLGAFK